MDGSGNEDLFLINAPRVHDEFDEYFLSLYL